MDVAVATAKKLPRAVRAEGSEGLIDVALSGFEGTLEEGGK